MVFKAVVGPDIGSIPLAGGLLQEYLDQCARHHVCVASDIVEVVVSQSDGLVLKQLAATRNRHEFAGVVTFGQVNWCSG